MAWKQRRGKQYYYRSVRVGKRVKSEYLGTGYAAHLMQTLDRNERQEAQHKRQAWQATIDSEEQLDAMIDEVTALVNAYAGALMLITGHYQHKSQWRKKK